MQGTHPHADTHIHACARVCAKSPQSCSTLCNPWTVTRQAPRSMGFSRQEYWSGLPFTPPGDLPNPGIELMSPVSPALAGRFFTLEPPGKTHACSLYTHTCTPHTHAPHTHVHPTHTLPDMTWSRHPASSEAEVFEAESGSPKMRCPTGPGCNPVSLEFSF